MLSNYVRHYHEAGLDALTSEVIKSSAIEGTVFEPASVRSSIARRLGIAQGTDAQFSRDVEGAVEMMLDATQRYAEPLTVDRLLGWRRGKTADAALAIGCFD